MATRASHGDSLCPRMRRVYSGAPVIILALGLFKLLRAGGQSVRWGARKRNWINALLSQITAKLVCGMWAFLCYLSGITQPAASVSILSSLPQTLASSRPPISPHSQLHPRKTLHREARPTPFLVTCFGFQLLMASQASVRQ